MTSIRTKYLPATDTTGSRIQAAVRSGQFKGKQITVGVDHGNGYIYDIAARALADRLGIVGSIVEESHDGYVKIFNVVALPVETVIASDESDIPVQVVTVYRGPEGVKGERIGARVLSGVFEGKRVTVGYDYAARDPHVVAVNAVLAKVGIVGVASESGAELGNGYIYDIAVYDVAV